MIKIAVCDDEDYFRNYLKKLISIYMKKIHKEYSIAAFGSGESFLRLKEDIAQYDIVFLDINMKGISGLVTAEDIRKISSDVNIVFVTAFISYALEGYKFNAVRYIVKDNDQFNDRIEECLDAILSKINRGAIRQRFAFLEGERNINLDKIVFMESNLHKVSFHLLGERAVQYSLYEKLSTIEERLSDYGFIRIHQSYLVNIKHISMVKNFQVEMKGGLELPSSKSRFRAVRDAFLDYKGEL